MENCIKISSEAVGTILKGYGIKDMEKSLSLPRLLGGEITFRLKLADLVLGRDRIDVPLTNDSRMIPDLALSCHSFSVSDGRLLFGWEISVPDSTMGSVLEAPLNAALKKKLSTLSMQEGSLIEFSGDRASLDLDNLLNRRLAENLVFRVLSIEINDSILLFFDPTLKETT